MHLVHCGILTQFLIVVISRRSREGRMRRRTNTSKGIDSTGARPRVRRGGRSCQDGAGLLSRNRCGGRKTGETNNKVSVKSYKKKIFMETEESKYFQRSVVFSVGYGFTWWWQVTMEENTSTWGAVQFLTQQQATHCQPEGKNTELSAVVVSAVSRLLSVLQMTVL